MSNIIPSANLIWSKILPKKLFKSKKNCSPNELFVLTTILVLLFLIDTSIHTQSAEEGEKKHIFSDQIEQWT